MFYIYSTGGKSKHFEIPSDPEVSRDLISMVLSCFSQLRNKIQELLVMS